jgi:hypothetical protein
MKYKICLLAGFILVISLGMISVSCGGAQEEKKPPETNSEKPLGGNISAVTPNTISPANTANPIGAVTAVSMLPVEKNKTYKMKVTDSKTALELKIEDIKGNWIKTTIFNQSVWINGNFIESLQEK